MLYSIISYITGLPLCVWQIGQKFPFTIIGLLSHYQTVVGRHSDQLVGSGNMVETQWQARDLWPKMAAMWQQPCDSPPLQLMSFLTVDVSQKLEKFFNPASIIGMLLGSCPQIDIYTIYDGHQQQIPRITSRQLPTKTGTGAK